MQKRCVLCLKDYFREIYQGEGIYIEAGELLDLDAGKIYNDDTYWICDLYSNEGIKHFTFIGDDTWHFIVNDCEGITSKIINELKSGGINEIHPDISTMLVHYSKEEDRYRTMSEDTLIEGMESVVKLLKSEDFTPCMDKVDLLLDSIWCSLVLLDKEIKSDLND